MAHDDRINRCRIDTSCLQADQARRPAIEQKPPSPILDEDACLQAPAGTERITAPDEGHPWSG
jgi:hypothetical protein